MNEGSKLKEKSANAEAMGKKLRTGKKDTKLTPKEKEEIKRLREKGRRRIQAEASIAQVVHSSVAQSNEDDNVAVEAADSSLELAGRVGRGMARARYGVKAHSRERMFRQQKKTLEHNTEQTAKEIQKKRMRREMIERERRRQEKETANSLGNLGRKFVDQAEDLAGKMGEWIKEHVLENPLGLILGGVIALVMLVVTSSFSSCSLIMSGMGDSTLAGSFTAEDAAIQQVEADYTALENGLRNQIARVETDYPGYDEYRYDLAEIGHNSYQLTALLTVLYEDFTREEVQGKLAEIFAAQYSYSTKDIVETRTRTVTYEEEEEYDYYILQITLTNATLDAVIRSMNLNEEQMERYNLLLQTLGNRPDIFSGSIYDIPLPGEFTDYGIPPEYLTDVQFANMIREGEKYLGYPYVWGGASPATSFDCSGFVSYVINNCGNGWNMGRQTANGLLAHCTPVSREEAKPGDLIFFQGTYDTAGASHVGIYVGDGMMLHCGNPIQYTSINTTYWQDHFYTFGRINQ